MKKLICSLLLLSVRSFSQQGPKWATGGNSISNDDFIGTTNNFPMDFKINNTSRMLLGTDGNLTLNNLAGTGNRMLMSDATGKLIGLPAGNAGQFLQGDGTWGNLPGGATSWQLIGNNLISTNTGNIGIGTSNPLNKLEVVGNVSISNNLFVGGGLITSQQVDATTMLNAGDINATNNLNVQGNSNLAGNLTISSMAGTDIYEVNVNQGGQLIKGFKKLVTACVPNAPQWYIGGNNVIPLINNPNTGLSAGDIGTCDETEFVLKANNVRRQWVHPAGSITFGTNIGSNTGGPEYRFNSGVIRLQSMNSYGGPQIVWDGGVSPYGDWGLEYLSSNISAVPGLNFWKPFGSPNSTNYLFFIGDDGKVTVGNNTPASAARFNVDGWSGDAMKAITDNLNAKTISLNFKTQNNSLQENFSVLGNGYTEIKVYNPLSMPNNRAFVIKDMAANRDLFVVKSDGKAYAREVEISLVQNFPDYVFAKDYKLKPLSEVADYIEKNNHLPGFEKGEHYEKNGINVTDIILKQQKTIEELTLYNIQLEKRLTALEKNNK